ncbi:MAG: hypothetical protein K6E85_02050 [Lachnospiraceae bacterium]|nr:hypothetical protein [Lachnospiraceae bacterium]
MGIENHNDSGDNKDVNLTELKTPAGESLEQRKAEHDKNARELDDNQTIQLDDKKGKHAADGNAGGPPPEKPPHGPEDGTKGSDAGKLNESDNAEKEIDTDKVREITKPYYDKGEVVAQNSEIGKAYTDHKEDHVEMVNDQSQMTIGAIEDGIKSGRLGNTDGIKDNAEDNRENGKEPEGYGKYNKEDRVVFNDKIDRKTLEGAALSHDTGMSGDGYALVPIMGPDGKQLEINGKKQYETDENGKYKIVKEDNSDFNQVRENHSLNSALNVLKNREQYKEAGYSDEQIDKMAAECMAHSKSSSGVKDVNYKPDWEDCFNRMDCAIESYNKDHKGEEISFDKDALLKDDEKLGSLATESYALRIGDVSRNSGPNAESQSGEVVYVKRDTLDNKAQTPEGEVAKATITVGGEEITNEKSRIVHAGEQNITNNETKMTEEGLTHTVTVNDGNSAPRCTQKAIEDHVGELASAGCEKTTVEITFNGPCNEETKQKYNEFKDAMETKYENVEIVLPWPPNEKDDDKK